MAEWQGLWSYVHADDEAECGRITQLARDVAAQFEMLTGERINLFLDRDAIQWGEDWHSKIDEGLGAVAFFIAVITPRYFRSPECRRELQSFVGKARSLGISELFLPLLYVDVPALHEEDPKDDLVEIVCTFQKIDWQALRFEDVCSGVYRRAVSDLAARLVAANARAEAAGKNVAETSDAMIGTSEDAGALDKIVESEIAIGEWTENLNGINADIRMVGELMTQASQEVAEVDAKHGTFTARLAVTERLARQLQGPADRILDRSNAFTSHLYRVDAGLRLIIEAFKEQVGNDPKLLTQACEFFNVVRTLSNTVHVGLENIILMIESSKQVEQISRHLRGPLRKINQGLTRMLEGREVSDGWIRLIEETGLDCDSVFV